MQNKIGLVVASLAITVVTANAQDLSESDIERVCRATVASLFGRDPAIINIDYLENGTVQVSYRRPSDGTKWVNQCRLEADRVVWRSDDLNGPGSGPGRWRTDPADETVRFQVQGGAVSQLVGICCGVVSCCFNPNESSVDAPDRRPRHDKHYHEGRSYSA